MKSNTNKFLLTAALSVAMVGCGGGGSDDGGGGGGTPSIPTVEGSMVSVNMSGKNFQATHTFNESMVSSMCEASTAYFETENVMAYSAASHTEGQLQDVASKVEHAMKGLIGKFGFGSMAELHDRKRAVSHPGISYIANDLVGLSDSSFNQISMDQLSTFFVNNPPEGFTGWDDPELFQDSQKQQTLVRNALISAPNGSEVPLIIDEMITNAESLSGQDLTFVRDRLSDALVHDKIQVCVLPDHMAGAAEGHTIGFNIAASEQYSFYVHEGAHFIQKQFAERFPRWLTEGQAVVFSGQGTATSKSNVDIMSILTFDDERNLGSDFYGDYGLAYKALAANSSLEEIMSFLQAYDLNPEWIIDYSSSRDANYQIAADAFAKTFLSWPGGTITYEQFSEAYAALAQ